MGNISTLMTSYSRTRQFYGLDFVIADLMEQSPLEITRNKKAS
jgi:hypothetical protein